MADCGHRGIIGCVLSAVTAVMIAVSTAERYDGYHALLEQQPSVYPDQGEIEAAKLRPAISRGAVTCTTLGMSTVCD